jgi:hypothetical protein
MSDKAQAAYIKKHGSAPNVAGDDAGGVIGKAKKKEKDKGGSGKETKQQKGSKIEKDEHGRPIKFGEKDKSLDQDIDTGNTKTFNESAEPPDDDKFKEDNKEHSVPGTQADLENDPRIKAILEAAGFPPQKFPKKYLKVLSRMLNSHGDGKPVIDLKHYIGDGGAGEIHAQAGELITMIGSTLPPEEREKFFKVIEDHLDAQMDPEAKPPTAPTDDEFSAIDKIEDPKQRVAALNKLQEKYPHLKIATSANKKRIKSGKSLTPSMKNWKKQNNLVVNHGWLHAARQNNKAIDNYIKKNFGDDVEIVAGAWDVDEEAEALGLSPPVKKNKGHSTDQYIKVRDKKTGKTYLIEVSLKKDGSIRLTNSSPAKLLDYDSMTDKEKKDFAKSVKNDNNIEDVDGDGNVTVSDITEGDFLKRQSKRYTDWMNDKKTKKAKRDKAIELINSGVIKPHAKLGFKKDMYDKDGNLNEAGLAHLDKIINGKGDTRKRNDLFIQIIDNSEGEGWQQSGKDMIEANISDAKKTVNNIVHSMKHEPLKSKMLTNIREALPLKALVEGEEMMALDDLSFDPDTMGEMFGRVPNENPPPPERNPTFNEIKEDIDVKTEDENGNPIDPPQIVYRAGKGQADIVIATVNVRQDGKGYGHIRMDMDLDPAFEKKMRESNEKVHGKKK